MANAAAVDEEFKYQLKRRVMELLENGARTAGGAFPTLDRDRVCAQLRQVLQGSLRASPAPALNSQEQERLIAELADDIVGTGPLGVLLADPDVTEIMVNGPTHLYAERQGRLERVPAVFRDTTHLMSVIERLLNSAGMSVTSSEPCVDASLPDGSRINVIVPPLVLNGPTVTIRKKLHPWRMDDYLKLESLSPQAAEFLTACVKARLNLIISGGTSTGKTTLVSILSSFIVPDERIVTIENVAELSLPHHEHWVRLVARSSNLEGRGEISLRMLVRNALRMRPDRIILGEARGGEALDVVQAMNSGHDGVMTVLHANSAPAALERLQTLMLMSGLDLPPHACQVQVTRAVDAVVHMTRFADGSRRIESIAQVLDSTGGGFQIEELFTFQVRGFRQDGRLEGGLQYTGACPKFLHKFHRNNIPIPAWMAQRGGSSA